MKLQKRNNPKKIIYRFAGILLCLVLAGCSREVKPIVIWTDMPEFAFYAELYNSQHSDSSAVVVYKESPQDSLPPGRDEEKPDIVVGSWLPSLSNNYFADLSSLFSESALDRDLFYSTLLENGMRNGKQYLLPVSFNLSAVVFDKARSHLLSDRYFVTPEEIKTVAASFNKTNKSGNYTMMGFAPGWDSDFIYSLVKARGVSFRYSGGNFLWNEESLEESIRWLREWTLECNTNSSKEDDYLYKYLYTPEIKWISENRAAFVCMDSDDFFVADREYTESMDFRWLSYDGKIPVNDDAVYMGVYKNSSQVKEAQKFLLWFMDPENQFEMLRWMDSMNFETPDFGIAGGFSSIREVNELYLISVFPQLLGNVPQEFSLMEVNGLPPHYDSLKERVLIPFLSSAACVTADDAANAKKEPDGDVLTDSPNDSFRLLLADWRKQYGYF